MLSRLSSFSGPLSKFFREDSYNGFTYDGMILRYEFRGTQSSYNGSLSITDLIGNSDATLYSGATYSINGYLEMDGINDYLITNESLALYLSPTNVETISYFLWVYPMDNGVIVSELDQSSPSSNWHDSQIEMVSGIINFGMWSSMAISSTTASIPTPFNDWYYIGLTYDGYTMNGYINGQLCATKVLDRNIPLDLYYSIGKEDTTDMGDGTYANMKLGAFHVYNRPLSSSEVLNNYNNQKDIYSDLIRSGLQLYLNSGNINSYIGSGTSWLDLSDNSYSASLINSILFSSEYNGFLTFDSGDYVDVNQSLSFEFFSVGAWFRTTSSGIKMILSKETAVGSPWNYRIWLNGGQIIVDISQFSTQSSLSSPLTSYNDGGWYYVMFTRDDNNWGLYVNGVQVSTKSDNYIGSIVNSQELWIGRSAYLGGSYQFVGDISEIMIYDRVLSDDEVLKNYNITKIRFGL